MGMWQLAGASWRGLAEENRAPAASARERTRFLPGGTRMWLTEPRWKNGSGELALPHASRGGGSHGIWGDPIRFRCLLHGRTCPPRPCLAGLFFFVFLLDYSFLVGMLLERPVVRAVLWRCGPDGSAVVGRVVGPCRRPRRLHAAVLGWKATAIWLESMVNGLRQIWLAIRSTNRGRQTIQQ